MTRDELRETSIARAKQWMDAHPEAYNRITHWCGGFFSATADQSMTRAVTLLLCLGALVPALAVLLIVYRHPVHQAYTAGDAGVITACASLAGAFVASGVVALANRSKPGEAPPNEQPKMEDKG